MIQELDKKEFKEIYHKNMVYDFPSNELKPYLMISTDIKKKKCIAIGYYDNDQLKGYATLLIAKNNLLLDYFAIQKEFRNQGFGTKFLNEIFSYFKEYDLLLVESDYYENEISKKRIQFYLNSQMKDSHLKAHLYFVDYCLLYKELNKQFNEIEVQEEIQKIYETVYPHISNTKFLKFHE